MIISKIHNGYILHKYEKDLFEKKMFEYRYKNNL